MTSETLIMLHTLKLRVPKDKINLRGDHSIMEYIRGQTKSEFDFSFVCYDKTCPFVPLLKGPDY